MILNNPLDMITTLKEKSYFFWTSTELLVIYLENDFYSLFATYIKTLKIRYLSYYYLLIINIIRVLLCFREMVKDRWRRACLLWSQR